MKKDHQDKNAIYDVTNCTVIAVAFIFLYIAILLCIMSLEMRHYFLASILIKNKTIL